MASFLKQAGDFTKNTAQTGMQGVSSAGNTVVGGLGSLNPMGKTQEEHPQQQPEQKAVDAINDDNQSATSCSCA
jgi:hypothetical protein